MHKNFFGGDDSPRYPTEAQPMIEDDTKKYTTIIPIVFSQNIN